MIHSRAHYTLDEARAMCALTAPRRKATPRSLGFGGAFASTFAKPAAIHGRRRRGCVRPCHVTLHAISSSELHDERLYLGVSLSCNVGADAFIFDVCHGFPFTRWTAWRRKCLTFGGRMKSRLLRRPPVRKRQELWKNTGQERNRR